MAGASLRTKGASFKRFVLISGPSKKLLIPDARQPPTERYREEPGTGHSCRSNVESQLRGQQWGSVAWIAKSGPRSVLP